MTPSIGRIDLVLGDILSNGPTTAKDIRTLLAAWDGTPQDVERILDALNDLLEGHGVEVIYSNNFVSRYWQQTGLVYVNTGDLYNPTVYFDTEKDRFYVGDVATPIERETQRFDT